MLLQVVERYWLLEGADNVQIVKNAEPMILRRDTRHREHGRIVVVGVARLRHEVKSVERPRHGFRSRRQARKVFEEVCFGVPGKEDLVDVPDSDEEKPIRPRELLVNGERFANTRQK